jgi:hypothetical protein
VSDDIYIYERGVSRGALNLNSTSYPDHGRYGYLPLQGKIPTAEPGIEPWTSWLVVRRSDHQATMLVRSLTLSLLMSYMELLVKPEILASYIYIYIIYIYGPTFGNA